MTFWKLAYTLKWVSLEQLRLAVITEARPHGEITAEQFFTITREVF